MLSRALSKQPGITTCFAHTQFCNPVTGKPGLSSKPLIASTALLHSQTTLHCQQTAYNYRNKIKNLRYRKQENKGAKLCSASASAFHHLLPNSPSLSLPPSLWSHSYISFTPQPITPSYQPALPCHCFLHLHDAKEDQKRSQYLFKGDKVWH